MEEKVASRGLEDAERTGQKQLCSAEEEALGLDERRRPTRSLHGDAAVSRFEI